MKKRLLFLAMAALPVLAVIPGCNDTDDEPDRITFTDGEPEIIFQPGDETTRTLAFSTNASWSVDVPSADWVEVTPAKGGAGDAKLTVTLLETECEADREVTAKIYAGSATATFRIVQKAAPATDDRITFPDGKPEIIFLPDGETTLTVAFNATSTWTAALKDAVDWVEVTPAEGDAGDAQLTVRLLETVTEADRETFATISSGSATESFSIVQKATAIAPQRISITAPQKKIVVGQTMTLEVVAEPAGADLGQVEWSSSDPAVLSVDTQGAVTALALGTATVTATAGELSADCPLEVVEVFTTDGEGRSYTFDDLAQLEYSGVKVEGGDYIVTENIVISEEDTLVIGNGEQIRVKNEKEIRILGTVDFTPESSAKASLKAYDNSSVPAPLYFTGTQGGGRISNVDFDNLPIRFYGSDPLTIDNCQFTGITDDYAAINMGGSGLVTVTECDFLENGYPAIAGGANMTTPLVFKKNYLFKNSNNTRNRPQINVTVAGDGKVEIIDNIIIGPGEITMNGGIAVANMLGLAGTNQVLIEGNTVKDCRYGITTNGVMDVRIIDNVLENNKWDSNPMNGGSGVSIYNSTGGQKVYMKGNIITGHLWGITNIGNVGAGKGPELNLGNLAQGDDYNPGGNVFRDNGNNGVLYDLYNNSPVTVYAQGNTWNVATQDQQSIESVIFHKNDNASLGEVIFMPAAQ